MPNLAHESARSLIYVVEDDLQIARLLCAALDEFGFLWEHLRTGADAMRRLRVQRPDLCIVDLGLPDMDGMELVRHLRQHRGCGVLILTGRSHPIDRIMGLELGADDYVTKPFDSRELIARVRSILRRCATNHPTAQSQRRNLARFSGWTLDLDSNTLSDAEGNSTPLSTAEAQLLRLFLEQPGRILNREKLLGERDLSSFDRSIDVRISRLRRKLNEDPQHPKLIKTVYGAGYLFASQVEWDVDERL